MTGFQLTRSQAAVAPVAGTWVEPAQAPAQGRHASVLRAKLTLRRLFYAARHAAG